jgi:thiamine biosynthesis lipoprotein
VADELVVSDRAMASRVTIRLTAPADERARAAVADAVAVLHEVDRTCTRFDPGSDLMLANAAGEDWQEVSPTCFDALVAAAAAYRRTAGRFDPRVLDDLVRLGYARSTRVAAPGGAGTCAPRERAPLPDWRPDFNRRDHRVRIGAHPVDLGGIAKGLAVRWAAQRLDGAGAGHLVDAGGDCHCAGRSPDGPWRIAVEDPTGGPDPVAVLELYDAAVATSSVRLLRWDAAGSPVHHLVDPASGLPGGAGLLSVTVVDDDPAEAEVWSKVLFLTGRRGVRTTAAHHGLAALWVDDDGVLSASDALTPKLAWVA